jgi:RimJ/RimL family protein N-acetyltransferase
MKLDLGQWQVRSYRMSDLKPLVKYANNRNVSINLTDRFPHPYRSKDAKRWLEFVTAHEPETNFAIASEHEVIGGIGFELKSDIYRLSAEIGYWLGEPFWGKGIATKAVKAVTEFAFDRFDLERVYAGVFETNPASARVLEKAGYVREGCFQRAVIKEGKIIDLLIYARLKDKAKRRRIDEGE